MVHLQLIALANFCLNPMCIFLSELATMLLLNLTPMTRLFWQRAICTMQCCFSIFKLSNCFAAVPSQTTSFTVNPRFFTCSTLAIKAFFSADDIGVHTNIVVVHPGCDRFQRGPSLHSFDVDVSAITIFFYVSHSSIGVTYCVPG